MNLQSRLTVFSFLLLVVFLLAATLNPSVVFAQTNAYYLSGTITSDEGTPVNGANVYSHTLELGTTSNESGEFSLGPINCFPSDIIVFQISSVGFRTKQVKSTISELNLKIRLKRDVLELNEVVVESITNQAEGVCLVKVATINVEQLDRSSSPSRIESLASEPGVEMISMGSGVLKPVIRGLSGLRVATLFRGVRIESQAWGAEHGIYFPEQGIDRVEIIRGPGALVFGADAIGGVLNFLPENPLLDVGRESNISMRGFSATSGLQASFQTKKRSRHSHHAFSGGYNKHYDYMLPNGLAAENSRYKQFFAQGVWGYIRDWGKIEGVYSSSYNTAGLMGGGGFQRSGDHLVSTSATIISNNWLIKPSIGYQLNHRKEFDIPLNFEGVNVNTDSAYSNAGDVDLSLRILRFDTQAKRTQGEFTWLFGSQGFISTNVNNADEVFIPNASINELSAFSISTWERDKISLQIGIRYDDRNISTLDWSNNYKYLSYSLGSNYDLNDLSSLRVSFSHGNRAPGLSELVADGIHDGAYRYEIGNVELNHERSYSLDLGYELRLHNVAFDFSVYRNTIVNYIYLASTGEYIEGYKVYKFAATDAEFSGLELGLSFRPNLIPGLYLSNAISYVRGVSTEGYLPLIPPMNLHSELGYERSIFMNVKDVYANISSDLVASAVRVSSGESISPGYGIVNFSLGASLAHNLTLGLAAKNLFNKEYIPHLSLVKNMGIPQAGRSISLRLVFKVST
ncbi:MAG: hypothetical protein COA49_09940 [Bacteroidetes bacterium]|nr:MAG: hypothetical protein COA49_09940 [Bacteroidota bacterium]